MVPDGWSYHKLGELGDEKCPAVKAGPFGSSLKKEFYTPDGYKIYGQEQVISGDPNFGNYFINEEKFDELKSCAVKPGDILISLVGTIGRVLIIPENAKPGIINPRLLRVSVAKNKVHELFLKYYLEDSRTKHKLLSWAQGGTMGVLNAEMLKALPVPTPPLPEQKKIARILSTWGKAIETVEKLIENSKAQKKALMQQLLTGKRRLPGFDEEWKGYHLMEVANILVSPVDKKTIEGEKPVLLCNYTDVYYNTRITKSLSFMQATATDREINKFTLAVGDVLITKDSETPGDIAVPAYVSEDLGGVVCGYHLAILRPKKGIIDGEFLTYLLSMEKTRYYFFTLATGATRFGLSVGSIEKALLNLPPLKEQQEIASVLATVDKEIKALQQKHNCIKQEKKALMQQLLTGKRRVKLEPTG